MKEGERKTVQPEEHEKQLEFNREVVYKNQRLISVFFAEDGASLLCEWVECHLLCLRMHRYIWLFYHGFPQALLALSGAIYSFPDIAIYSESGVYLFCPELCMWSEYLFIIPGILSKP